MTCRLLLLTLWVASCGPKPNAVDHVRTQLRSGKPAELRQACKTLDQLVDQLVEQQQASRPRRLTVYRMWIDCLARTGELQRARRWLDLQPVDGGTRYARAMEEVARSPSGLPRAIALLRHAGREWPDQAEIYYRAGVLLLADDQPQAALPLLQRASRLDDTAAAAVAQAHALLDLGHVDKALEQARRVPMLNPTSSDIHRGRQLIQRLALRTGIIPEEARARFRLAVRHLQKEDRAGACISAVEEILVDYPRLAAAHTLLGLAHVRLNNLGEAVVALRQAAALNPLDATNPYFLAKLHLERGKREQSVDYYRQCLQLDPFHAQAAEQLGRTLLTLGRPAEASEVLEQLAAFSDEAQTTHLRLAARAHFQAGSLDKAEGAYRRLLEIDPHDFETNLRMGQLLVRRMNQQDKVHRRKLIDLASQHAQRARAVRPEDPELERLLQQLMRHK